MSDRNSSSSLQTHDGMAIAKGVGEYWLCGKGQIYPTLADLLAYLDSLSPALTEYNILVVTPCTETADYAIINPSLANINIQFTDPNTIWNVGDYQVLNFGNLGSLNGLTLGAGYITYSYSTGKQFIVNPVIGYIANFYFDAYIKNDSADGIDTTFYNGGNSAQIYSGNNATLNVSYSSQGGIYDVIWLGGPLKLLCFSEDLTAYNLFESSSSGINSIFSSLTINGFFKDGAGYTNPIINCDNLIIANLYVSAIAAVTIRAPSTGIANIWCDIGAGYILLDSSTRAKIGTGFTNTGRALLYDGGVYTFDGVTWEDFDLNSGFSGCNLRVVNNRFSGTDAGVIGSDYSNNSAVTVTTSGTTETTLAQLKTSAYTFTQDGDMLEFWGQFSNSISAGSLSLRIIIGASIYTISSTTSGNGTLFIKFFRKDDTTLRMIYDYEVSNTFSDVSNSADVTISTVAPITISVTAQMSNGADSVSMLGTSWRLYPQAT